MNRYLITRFKCIHIFHGISIIIPHTPSISRQVDPLDIGRTVFLPAAHFNNTRVFAANRIKVKMNRSLSLRINQDRIVNPVISDIFGQPVIKDIRSLEKKIRHPVSKTNIRYTVSRHIRNNGL